MEQSGESDYLKSENFAEMLTDQNVREIYGEEAGKEGAEGPWLEKGVEKKAVRIEHMLNFLGQTDKLWNRQAMLSVPAVFSWMYTWRGKRETPKRSPKATSFRKWLKASKTSLNSGKWKT